MPITKSAKKAARRSLVLQKRNNEVKIRLRMVMRKFLKKSEEWEKITQDELNNVYTAVDKAKKIGLIKKNTAARKKSRVARIFNTQESTK